MSELDACALMVMPLLFLFIWRIWSSAQECRNKPQTKTSFGLVITQTTIQPTLIDKNVFNEAKDVLVSMGFSATESKKMLNAVGPCDNVDIWVKKSLESIKI